MPAAASAGLFCCAAATQVDQLEVVELVVFFDECTDCLGLGKNQLKQRQIGLDRIG